MIITRTPFRIPLGGGGTDLPSYYSKFGGFIFSAAIDKNMFIYINRPIVDDFVRVKYSVSETVESVDMVKHELVREACRLHGIKNAIEVISMADVPAGTGLGSSSCYIVGLLNGIHTMKKEYICVQDLAEEACHIEIEVLGKPIGKQDQYLAAFGGLTVLDIDKKGTVKVRRAKVTNDTIVEFERNVLLFYTGVSRSSSDILSQQSKAAARNEKEVVENMHRIKEIGYQVLDAIESGDLTKFGHLLHEHWISKKRISNKMANSRMNKVYDVARRNGALGGKIMGAGGGGFFMFYVENNHPNFRHAMYEQGLREMRYRIDFEGTKVIANFMDSRNEVFRTNGFLSKVASNY